MRLPVTTPGHDAATLWRRYADLLFDRMLAVGEEASLPAGRGVTDGGDGFVVLPEDVAPDAPSEIASAMRDRGIKRLTWVVPPGGPRPAADVVRPSTTTLYRLRRFVTTETAVDYTTLPGRAAREAYGRVCRATADPADPWSARRPAHLDDPQFDGLLALDGRTPVGVGGLQTRGHTGGIFDLAVVPETRRRGVGRFLLGRVLELAARSQLSDVLVAVATENAAAVAFVEHAGFMALTPYEVVTTVPVEETSRFP